MSPPDQHDPAADLHDPRDRRGHVVKENIPAGAAYDPVFLMDVDGRACAMGTEGEVGELDHGKSMPS
jgi:hypothetical protein